MQHDFSERNNTLPGDMICLSHLRWGFVYQRPQHLISRFAKSKRVFYLEEPVESDGPPRLEESVCDKSGVRICTPHVPPATQGHERIAIQRQLLDDLIERHGIQSCLLWYYTPMALEFSRHLSPSFTVFDCMDELSMFAGAPKEMKDREAEMLRRADIVFTGGESLYEAKKTRHSACYCVPSSVDVPHFAQARIITEEAEGQQGIARPRIGFAGVIDERMDLELLDAIARLRPAYQFILVGPVVKIDPASLPRRSNIHYLGGRNYQDLPRYMAGWDAAMLPFAHNDSTRFISPTKTPEYLAAGRPVVSTSIADVVRPYGQKRLVRIADTPEEFVAACEAAVTVDGKSEQWRRKVDAMLAQMSWDSTCRRMAALIEERSVALARHEPREKVKVPALQNAFEFGV